MKKFLKSRFVQNYAKVLSGAMGSQILTLLLLPLLTRTYSTEQFGAYAIIFSLASLLGPVAAWRYEQAIMLPKTLKEANKVLGLASLLSILTVGVVALVAFVFTGATFSLANMTIDFRHYHPWIAHIFLSALSLSFLVITTLWLNRQERFLASSVLKILNVALIFGFQFAFKDNPNGLIEGLLVGQGLSLMIYLGILFWDIQKHSLRHFREDMRYSFKRYRDFAIYSVPASFLNNFATQLPVFMIKLYFGESATGIFDIVRKIIIAPITLIAGSLNNLVFQDFTKKIAHRQFIIPLFQKIVKGMTLMATLVVLALLLFVGFDLATVLLGKSWSPVSTVLPYFLPYVFTRFISRSIAKFAIYERQDIGLYFQIALFAVSLLAFVAGNSLGFGFEEALGFYALCVSVVFGIQVYISYTLAKAHDKSLTKQVK